MVLADSNAVGSTQATIRFAKAAAGTTAIVDFYVTAPGASIATATPLYTGVTLGSVSQPYATFSSGTYEVRETATGSKVPFIDQEFTLSGGTATTLLDLGTTAFFVLSDQ